MKISREKKSGRHQRERESVSIHNIHHTIKRPCSEGLIAGSVHSRSADGNTLKHDLSFQASMKHFAKFVMAKPSPSRCSESALAESHRQLRREAWLLFKTPADSFRLAAVKTSSHCCSRPRKGNIVSSRIASRDMGAGADVVDTRHPLFQIYH
jgi:hypothetical protein